MVARASHRCRGEMRSLAYGVVTTVRDDAVNLERLGRCLIAQSRLPLSWLIVDQGSTDASARVGKDFARRHDWVEVVTSPGPARPTRGAPIAEAFELGVAALPASVEIVVRIDADVSMDEEFCARLVHLFESDDTLGIASGSRWELEKGVWRRRFVVGPSVEAQCRAYRRACLTAVLPLDKHRGWDGVDVVQAELLGWGTLVAGDLGFRHHRAIGARDGSRLRAWAGEGSAAYSMGYRLSYLSLRALYRARRDPWAVGLLVGYARAAVLGTGRASEPVRRYVRDQQSPKHLRERARQARGERKWEHADVLLAAEPGGHLLELYTLRDVWQHYDRTWVTLPAIGSLSLLTDERVVFARGPTCRNIGNLLRNLWVAWQVIGRYRPKLIVATGSGLVVPLLWIARLRGVKSVYIECGGRTDRPSLSCRLVCRVANQLYVQWPELVDVVHGARYAGNILSVAGRTPRGRGIGVGIRIRRNEQDLSVRSSRACALHSGRRAVSSRSARDLVGTGREGEVGRLPPLRRARRSLSGGFRRRDPRRHRICPARPVRRKAAHRHAALQPARGARRRPPDRLCGAARAGTAGDGGGDRGRTPGCGRRGEP